MAFLIGIELCLSFICTIQLSRDLESVWLRVKLGSNSLDSVNISKTFVNQFVTFNENWANNFRLLEECVSYDIKKYLGVP